MRVGRRLFLAVIPAVLGVLAMAALAYWGERGRQVPHALVWAGIGAATVSLGLAWHNTRHVARRLESLAARRPDSAARDEIESIENAVAGAVEAGRARADAAELRSREYTALLADAAGAMARGLDEVRLPLHILLESPFGELNENQEEMIAAAHSAAARADERVRTLARILQADSGGVRVDLQPIRPLDLLAPLLNGGAPESDVPPTLPHVRADVRLAREALSLILEQLARKPAAPLHIDATTDGASVEIRIHAPQPAPREFALATRLLRLQGGDVMVDADGVRVRLRAFTSEARRKPAE
ncbi:MAG TPA: hypothetical protein VF625_15915, partial [Longimicrobium sp.]